MTDVTVPAEHREFLTLVPKLEKFARFWFRHQSSSDPDEAVADVIAQGFVSFLRLKQRGKNPTAFPTAFARFMVLGVSKGQAVGRRFNSRDVLAGQNRRAGRFSVHRFDDAIPDGGGWWREVVADRRMPVPDEAAFNIDFPKWLTQIEPGKRRIAELLAHGYSTNATARLVRVTPGRVSQVRRELAVDWNAFHDRTRARSAYRRSSRLIRRNLGSTDECAVR